MPHEKVRSFAARRLETRMPTAFPSRATITILDALHTAAARTPQAVALEHDGRTCTYAELSTTVSTLARGLHGLGFGARARIALYADKSIRMVGMLLAILRAGCIAVPLNPRLKPAQVHHALRNCAAAGLVVNALRRDELVRHAATAQARVLLIDLVRPETDVALARNGAKRRAGHRADLHWDDCLAAAGDAARGPRTDTDPALLIYTSGSTGLPKGVVVSHRNLVVGAESVGDYLQLRDDDVILGLLPMSFDAGLSQLTTALIAGARLSLHNYASARFVPALCARVGATTITAIPPLWSQLAAVAWGDEALAVRSFATTGGHMPAALLKRLRGTFARARPFLMYGLTEAFRSTYLNPDEIDRRPDSIGKAIPNAEILVLRPNGSLCAPGEAGELVHRGPLVAQGYWNDKARTRERFRPLPKAIAAGTLPEYAVWSGDIVRMDEDGFLYFIGRRDELMKISGYRVSPTEIEKAVMRVDGVHEAVAFGIPDAALGTAPVVALVPKSATFDTAAALVRLARDLPAYMVPTLSVCDALPRTANGKLDRDAARQRYLSAQSAGRDSDRPSDRHSDGHSDRHSDSDSSSDSHSDSESTSAPFSA